jgi:UDP-glucose 4-epimerase
MAMCTEAVGEVFNAGNDECLSLAQIAQAIVDAAGTGAVGFTPWPADRDAIDIGSYFSDSSKAKRILGWTAVTPFQDGISHTIEYYRRHLDWYL